MSLDKQRYESWEAAHRHDPDRPIVFAATVMVLRDQPQASSDTRLEVLMVKRAKQLAFGGGSWVFPGGKVDQADLDNPYQSDAEPLLPSFLADVNPNNTHAYLASQTAGVREVQEETGLLLSVSDLVCFSHWVPPAIAPKRFATWFFVAVAPENPVITVDGGEIVQYRWITPSETLLLRDQGEIEMLPPTYVSLTELASCDNSAEALELAKSRPPPLYATKIAVLDNGAVSMWEGDAGYDSGDAHAQGSRHRLAMSDEGWEYQRSIL